MALSGCAQETTLRFEDDQPTSGADTRPLSCGTEATLEVEYRIEDGDFLVFVQDGNGTTVFSRPFTSGDGDVVETIDGQSGTWHVTVSRDGLVGLADVRLKC